MGRTARRARLSGRRSALATAADALDSALPHLTKETRQKKLSIDRFPTGPGAATVPRKPSNSASPALLRPAGVPNPCLGQPGRSTSDHSQR